MQPLDRRDRSWALLLTVVAAASVVVLAARIRHGGTTPLWLDTQGQRVAFGHVFGVPMVPDRAAHLVVLLGNTPVFAALAGAVIIGALVLRDRISALVALAACPLALLATEVIGKPLVGRKEGSSFGFPSGHSTAITTLVTLVALVAYRRWQRRGLIAITPLAVLVPTMGLALVRINFHQFSDTVAGALVGGGTVLGLAWLASAFIAARSSASAKPS